MKGTCEPKKKQVEQEKASSYRHMGLTSCIWALKTAQDDNWKDWIMTWARPCGSEYNAPPRWEYSRMTFYKWKKIIIQMLNFLRHGTEGPLSPLQNEGFELDQWFPNSSLLAFFKNQSNPLLKNSPKTHKIYKTDKKWCCLSWSGSRGRDLTFWKILKVLLSKLKSYWKHNLKTTGPDDQIHSSSMNIWLLFINTQKKFKIDSVIKF